MNEGAGAGSEEPKRMPLSSKMTDIKYLANLAVADRELPDDGRGMNDPVGLSGHDMNSVMGTGTSAHAMNKGEAEAFTAMDSNTKAKKHWNKQDMTINGMDGKAGMAGDAAE